MPPIYQWSYQHEVWLQRPLPDIRGSRGGQKVILFLRWNSTAHLVFYYTSIPDIYISDLNKCLVTDRFKSLELVSKKYPQWCLYITKGRENRSFSEYSDTYQDPYCMIKATVLWFPLPILKEFYVIRVVDLVLCLISRISKNFPR